MTPSDKKKQPKASKSRPPEAAEAPFGSSALKLPPLPPKAAPTVRERVAALIRARILAGMVILVPLGVTGLLTYRVGEFLHSKFKDFLAPYIKELAHTSPALSGFLASNVVVSVAVVLVSIVIIAVVIYAAGLLSTAYLVKRVIRLGEKIIERIPVISFFYGILKQIMDTVAMQQEAEAQGQLQRVVMVQYPRPGIYALGFVTGETVIANDGRRYVNVFLPTTPNPTSGFLLLLPLDEVEDTNLTFEVGVKFLVSGGILVPENLRARPYNPGDDGTFEEAATIHEPDAEELLAAELEHARREAAEKARAEAEESASEKRAGEKKPAGKKSGGGREKKKR